MTERPPTGRLARGLALVKLAATELPGVATRALRGDAEALDLVALRHSAERAARVLGDLRGLALKLGQTMSYVDGLLPEEATDVYQRALATLQAGAPTVSFDEIRAELERGLGRPLTECFVRFDPEPIAAASIGQVHRAAITDPDDPGRVIEVAVKVQYPSIARAVESDLKNLDTLRPMISVMAPGADTDGGVDEVVAHLGAELDYTLEARNQARFRELVDGDPDAFVPRVFPQLTARNVITMEFVEGRPIREVAEGGTQAERDRVGRGIFRNTLALALRRGVFNTDPHPGNYLVRADGVVALLDFGSVKELPGDLHARWRELAGFLVRGELDAWRERAESLFGMAAMDPRARRIHQDYMLQTAAMVARDEEVTIDRALLRAAVERGVATVSQIGREMGWVPSRKKTAAVPPDFVMLGRMQLGLFAVLARLRPRANWNRILRDALDAP